LSGRYFVKKAEAHSSHVSYDKRLARRLWEVSADLTNLPKQPCSRNEKGGRRKNGRTCL
jgi:hypothetical protein